MTQRVLALPPTDPLKQPPQWARHTLAVVCVVVAVGALLALIPFWVPLVLAAWTAMMARPLHQTLAKRIHRRRGAAAMLTVLLVVAFLTPVFVTTLSLAGAAVQLGKRLLESGSGEEALRSLAHAQDAPVDLRHIEAGQMVDLLQQHGTSAWSMARMLSGAATIAIVGVVIFVSAFYTFLLEGPRLGAWLLEHSPLSRGNFQRLASVFEEVGRGLLIGVGVAALLQGAVATVGYVVLGVPQPLVIGLATVFASLVPSIGSGLVWAPVAAGLWISGRPGAAIAMVAIGCVVGLVDNVLRPLLAKYGNLRMHGLLLFMAMLGGMAVFGAGGLLLGPLLVRIAIECLRMLRESEPQAFPASR